MPPLSAAHSHLSVGRGMARRGSVEELAMRPPWPSRPSIVYVPVDPNLPTLIIPTKIPYSLTQDFWEIPYGHENSTPQNEDDA